jgi:hypothetical protein
MTKKPTDQNDTKSGQPSPNFLEPESILRQVGSFLVHQWEIWLIVLNTSINDHENCEIPGYDSDI